MILGRQCSLKMCFSFRRTICFQIFVCVIFLFELSTVLSNVSYKEEASYTIEDISSLLKKFEHKNVNLNAEFHRSKRKLNAEDNTAHGFDDHEVVIPIRLHHETGHPVSHGRHFRRRNRDEDAHPKMRRRRRDLGLEHNRERYLHDLAMQRRAAKTHDVREGTFYDVIPDKYSDESLDFINEKVGDYLDHSVANYSLQAFGEHFLFHLTPYEEFLAPNYSLRYVADPSRDAPLHPDVPRHCFYAGYVNGKRDHKAILSVCRGLFGAFRTDKHDYLIQPEEPRSNPNHDDEADEEGTKPHRIFRRSTETSSKGKRRCGYVDAEAEQVDSESHFADIKSVSTHTKDDGGNSMHIRRLLENARRQEHRKKSRKRILLRYSEVHSNSSLSGMVLKKLGVSTLVNSLQVLRELNQRERASFRSKSSRFVDSTKRRRRYLSYARNVEVMVTADNSMLQLHRDVEHYVLTLMAIVNHVFHDPSIQNLINIVIVELVVIGDSQVQHGPNVVKNAHTCLRNFCDWQFRHNNLDDSHPSHHDTAVLITGKNICRTETACDTLGLAELGTMCDPRRSCSINEDNGLSTAFTIAHEIGHEFNAPHDNSDKCLDSEGRKSPLNVMSPTLDINAHPWSWSNCSAKFITNFLDNGGGRCLLDEPPQRVLSLPIEEPGEVFNANDQCSFVYGKGVAHCNFMNTCKRLWCISENITHGCRTPHVPWADGTRCGDRMWCQKGQCVPENRHRIPIDGNWGEWGRFGECSRKCGGGVKIAVRECNNPKPQYGGQYCTGRRKKYRSCNYHECPENTDIRVEQCSAYNDWAKNRTIRVRGVSPNAEWIPKYDGIPEQDRCKLICQVRPRGHSWYILKPKVINGTPCGPDTHDICVDGVCKPAGCDHVLNSNAKEDTCGVCNGDDSGCRWIEGRYNIGDIIGYHDVVTIPSGATNILITQESFSADANDNNYLALKDTSNSYILNGNRSVMRNKHKMRRRKNGKYGKYDYYCDYSGTDNRTETINCSKTTGIDIVVQVLSAGDLVPPNIKYKFKVPVAKTAVSYTWNINGNWSSCNKECDGKMRRKISCIRSDEQEVSERRCSHMPKPNPITQSCNTACRFEWTSTHRSECSARCGRGVRTVEFGCVKITNDFSDKEVIIRRARELVSDSLCPNPKPQTTIPCQVTCFHWMTSPIGQCSATCGGGVQHQKVWCGETGSERSDDDCDPSNKPQKMAPCNEHECPKWKYGKWGECSVTCGRGLMARPYQCIDHEGGVVKPSFCEPSLLHNSRSCNSPRTCRQSWSNRYADSDFPSMVVRGLGRRRPTTTTEEPTTRTTTTSEPIAARPRVRSSYNSDSYGDVSVVNSRRHVARWRTGSWTPCSKSCGGGIRFRYVSCRHIFNGDEMHDSECGMEQDKPPAKDVCQTNPCSGVWRTGSWSECSATCGKGVRSRYVGCLYDGHYERNSENCLAVGRPSEREECDGPSTCDATTTTSTTTTASTITTTTLLPSNDVGSVTVTSEADRVTPTRRNRNRGIALTGRWRVGPWTKCSNFCGDGFQKRIVACRSPSNRPATCSSENRPPNQQSCRGEECPRWRTGAWEKCSRSCGNGTRSRRVYCVIDDVRPTLARKCDVTQRPVDVIQCNLKQCLTRHRWRKSAWSSCSVTCGRGTKTRQVQCVDARGRVGEDALCAIRRRNKPREVGRCVMQQRCPKWRSGKWGRCSATCGEGQMSRRVSCKYKRKVIVDQLCDVTKRPDDVKLCNVSQCWNYQWWTEEWSSCSVSCGEGLQHRAVACRNINDGMVVSDDFCLRVLDQDKPLLSQMCAAGPCTASWVIGPWSECSKTCGPGIQRRDITCTYIHPRNYSELEADSCDITLKPYDVRDCDRGHCNARVYWRVGSWSRCSTTCGLGHSVRRVVCSDRITQSPQNDDVCQAIPSFRPDRTRTCREAPCVPRTCLQLKLQQEINTDGEYYLKVEGKMAKIYCKGMETSHPTEYLTLVSGSEENYSEIFGFRLIDADTCPGNGTRDPDCPCHRDHPDEGYTMFEKVRFDVSSLRIIATDFSFASTRFGKPVAYGVAGDCYSRNNCPQGVFRINLKDTGFAVREETSWRSYGIDSTKRIYKSHVGDVIAGICGGYCSRCQPDPNNGLLLRHSDR